MSILVGVHIHTIMTGFRTSARSLISLFHWPFAVTDCPDFADFYLPNLRPFAEVSSVDNKEQIFSEFIVLDCVSLCTVLYLLEQMEKFVRGVPLN